MRKAKNIKVGSIVEVPYYQFAPFRSGWNGWLFTKATVKQVGKNDKGLNVAIVEYEKDNKIIQKGFLFTNCFEA